MAQSLQEMENARLAVLERHRLNGVIFECADGRGIPHMRQTVMIVTALMIALLAVSVFIVAGSVEQMRQIT